MKRQLIKLAVRTRFRTTDRDQASKEIRDSLDRYRELADTLTPELGKRPVTVPPMLGIDEDMRGWSFYMILEHNAIVNRSITEIVRALALGEEPGDTGVRDPKKDVMPSDDPGEEQVEAFRTSVEDHLATISRLPQLRKTKRKPHPIFGNLDAHGWHCMFSLHLDIHLKQAKSVIEKVTQNPSRT